MTEIFETMETIINKCNILIENEVISKDELLSEFSDFLLNTFNKDKHNVGIVLHNGSVCFDAVLLIYAVASCLIYNETETNDIVSSLNIGDSVLYGIDQKSRYFFNGKIKYAGKEYVKLSQTDVDYILVPIDKLRFISPYKGESKTFDGRGIRKTNKVRDEFYKTVLNYAESDIPVISDVSVVIVMPRDRVEFLLENLEIEFKDKKVKPLELVTASYCTENDEYQYGGNASKNEANLKFTGKVSVARELVLCKDGNKHIGIIVSGNEMIERGKTEIPELIRRRSLQFVYICMNTDSENAEELIKEASVPNLFACTKQYLKTLDIKSNTEGKYCKDLYNRIQAVIKRNIEPHILEGRFTWEEYKKVKKALYFLKDSDYSSDEKETFIVQSYSLLNLYLTSVFKISEVERCVKEGIIDIVSPLEKMNNLYKTAETLPDTLKEYSDSVIDFLETAYLYLEEKSGKEQYLKEIISENSDKKVVIVVPKAYYYEILKDCGIFSLMKNENLLTIVTVNKFDDSQLYDRIIVVGNIGGKRFDTFRCQSARRIETILYDFESHFFKYKMRNAHKTENFINSFIMHSENEDEEFDKIYASDIPDSEIAEVTKIDNEVDEYINRINESIMFKDFGFISSYKSSVMSEVVAIGTFDSGEKALFTKNYKAYVFDSNMGTVKETKVSDLEEGDSLVFTKNNSDTKDIVDNILSKLVKEKKLYDYIIEDYRKSKRWKQELINYMQFNDYTSKQIADKMIKNGVKVQENTIKGWLDEDSHTVGPRDIDSINQIAVLVEDDEMFENANQYFEACRIIRKVRREILKQIGEAIIKKLCNKDFEKNSVVAEIYERVDSIAQILTLESLSYVNKEVNMNLTNRPISI